MQHQSPKPQLTRTQPAPAMRQKPLTQLRVANLPPQPLDTIPRAACKQAADDQVAICFERQLRKGIVPKINPHTFGNGKLAGHALIITHEVKRISFFNTLPLNTPASNPKYPQSCSALRRRKSHTRWRDRAHSARHNLAERRKTRRRPCDSSTLLKSLRR